MIENLYSELWLNLNVLAKETVDIQYAQSPHFKKYGEAGYLQSIQDATFNLQFLLTAFHYDNSEILLNYLEWTDQLFQSLNLPANTLPEYFRILSEVMGRWLQERAVKPEEADAFQKLLTEARGYLEMDREAKLQKSLSPTPQNPYYPIYESAIFDGDRNRLRTLFNEMRVDGIPVDFIYGEIMQPFQRQLGALWHLQQISVAQEHFATAMSQYAMTLLYDQIFNTPRSGKRMLAACVSGELHEFGIRMIADYFEFQGWDTHFYGANNPQSSVVRAVLENQPDVIFLSCTMTFNLRALESLVSQIKAVNNTVPICVGGYPFDVSPVLHQQIGADYYTPNFKEAHHLAEQLAR